MNPKPEPISIVCPPSTVRFVPPLFLFWLMEQFGRSVVSSVHPSTHDVVRGLQARKLNGLTDSPNDRQLSDRTYICPETFFFSLHKHPSWVFFNLFYSNTVISKHSFYREIMKTGEIRPSVISWMWSSVNFKVLRAGILEVFLNSFEIVEIKIGY